MKVFGVIGGCRGKSGLIQGVVRYLTQQGLAVSTIKRVSDDVDLDRPGKDTYCQREAGAREIIVANSFRWALMHEQTGVFDEPAVEPLIARLSPVDLVLVEGFRLAPFPKLEVVLSGTDRRPQYRDDPSVIAIASDAPHGGALACYDLADVHEIARFVERQAVRFEMRVHA
ncbi:MAG TPA: molybdopterin-guanine dinucleotide biosynthesis protein B [Aliidongia sp.]|uniref:molybdopterin-guanine dinucleotide biosynthesis protein B n=1 Tax=Aliidongia sp. TaxID=1914230 RepID=UPI002DDDB33B|nr:molybdopterin-guanine dinucleotide biosynthesis protein B [Aliidongia sp.]HEV2677147.1 molybdopterin-guanine dinucleotide biosynthesis protein B [Aliidongia sp.]